MTLMNQGLGTREDAEDGLGIGDDVGDLAAGDKRGCLKLTGMRGDNVGEIAAGDWRRQLNAAG